MSIRDISKQQYVKTYEYLLREVGSNDLEKILKYILTKRVKPTTQFNYLNSIVSLKRADPKAITGNIDKIKDEREKIRETINAALSKSNLTERQKAVMDKVNRSDIEKVMKSLEETKDGSTRDLEDYILLHLMMPDPMRNDLSEILITKKRTDLDKFNSIYIPTKRNSQATIKIVDHKTSSAKFGKPIVKELSVDLTNDVKKFIKNSNLSGIPRVYLFQSRNGKPYSSSAFSHKFQRLFKKHLNVSFSATTLRKIFWTDQRAKIEEVDKQNKALHQSAGNMGHNLETAKRFYVSNVAL